MTLVKIFILLSMIFCHVVDDYYLQGWLASAKQRSWWESNAPDDLYRYDYIMALIMHGFSWTFMIMLVPTLYILLFGGTWNLFLFIGNWFLHCYIDNMKCNKKEINLIEDQSLHMLQILLTWLSLIIF